MCEVPDEIYLNLIWLSSKEGLRCYGSDSFGQKSSISPPSRITTQNYHADNIVIIII